MLYYSDMSDEDYDGFSSYDDYFMNYYDEFDDDDYGSRYSDDTGNDMDSPVYSEKYFKDKNRSEHCIKIMEGLNEDRRAGEMCDGVIKVGGQEFPVHRVVLKVASPYFRAMFAGSFDEREKKCIEIQDVSKGAFETILNFIYGEPGELTEENLLEVYNASDMLCVDNVLKECKDYLRCNCLQMNDKLAAYFLAKRMELIDTPEDIIKYFHREFAAVLKSPYFLDMPHEVLQEVMEKKAESLSPPFDIMLDAVIQWVAHDPHIRFSQADELVSKVHLDQVPSVTIDRLVKTLGTVHLDDEAMAKTRDSLVEKIQSNLILVRQMLSNFKIKLVGLSNSHSQVEMCEFHYSTLDWTSHNPSIALPEGSPFFPQDDKMPKPKFTTEAIQAVVLLKNEVYVFGSKTVLAYNLTTRSTRAIASLPHTRVNFCVVVYKSTMIVIGGDRQEILQYDFISNMWQRMCMWYHPRRNAGAVICNDVIYMMGGNSDKKAETCNYFTSYNIRIRRFIRLQKLERQLVQSNPHIEAFKNKLYVFGEHMPRDFLSAIFRPTESCLCQIYDIEKETWSDSKAKLQSSESIIDVVTIADGILVVVMNKVGDNTKITVSLYVPERDCLDYVGCLPLPREPSFLKCKYYLVEAAR